MAAAIILIPEMLSGPERRTPDSQAKADTPLKTYTIDLQQQTKPATTVIEERAPPPEHTAPADEATESEGAASAQVIPDSAPAPAAETAASSATSSRPEPQSSIPPAPAPTQATSPPAVSIPPTPAPTSASAAKTGRWAVQLGSFSREETARRLADDLRKDGREAFVMPVRTGAATLYRVRVGPMNDRASAEAMLSELKAKAPGAAVVSHP